MLPKWIRYNAAKWRLEVKVRCASVRYVFCRVISSPADSVTLEWSHFGLTALGSVGQAPYIKRIAIAGADRALNARAARTRADKGAASAKVNYIARGRNFFAIAPGSAL